MIENTSKFLAGFILVIATCLYFLAGVGSAVVEEEVKKEVPTYVIEEDGTRVLLQEYIAQEKKEVVIKKNMPVPSNFTTDQRQQREKVSKLLETNYGKDVFKHADKASKKYGVEKNLILAVILTESGFDQYAKNGNSHGLMQLSENTTASKACQNLYSISCNIDASTKHLAGLQAKYRQNDKLALAAYNAGGGSVDYALRRTGDIPKSTQDYVKKVNRYKQVMHTLVD